LTSHEKKKKKKKKKNREEEEEEREREREEVLGPLPRFFIFILIYVSAKI
jgi:hypothetical protein